MLQIRKMFRLLFFIIFLAKIDATEKSYFEERKEMLKKQKIQFYPRPAKTNIIPFYYEPSYYKPQKARPTEFETIINEANLCSQYEKVFLIIYVRTFYEHHVHRRVFRDLIDLYNKQESRVRVKHLFLFGRSRDDNVNKLIKEESLLFGDILQESYIEHYANLTLKTLQAWKWSLNYCPNAEYVMIMNDEMFLDLIKIIEHLFTDYLSFKHDDHYALCQIIGNRPSRHEPFMKDMDPEDLYKGKMMPSYCHGYGYIAHITVINKLYFASHTNPYFMPDDAWIGLLTEKLRLKMVDHVSKFGTTDKFPQVFHSPSYLGSPVMIGGTDIGSNKTHSEKILKTVFPLLKAQYEKLERFKNEMRTRNHYNLYNGNSFLELNKNPSIFFLLLISIVLIFSFKLFYLIFKRFCQLICWRK